MNPVRKTEAKNQTIPNHKTPHNPKPTKNSLQHSCAGIVEGVVVFSLSLQGLLCSSVVSGDLFSSGWGEISSVYQLNSSKQRSPATGHIG